MLFIYMVVHWMATLGFLSILTTVAMLAFFLNYSN